MKLNKDAFPAEAVQKCFRELEDYYKDYCYECGKKLDEEDKIFVDESLACCLCAECRERNTPDWN